MIHLNNFAPQAPGQHLVCQENTKDKTGLVKATKFNFSRIKRILQVTNTECWVLRPLLSQTTISHWQGSSWCASHCSELLTNATFSLKQCSRVMGLWSILAHLMLSASMVTPLPRRKCRFLSLKKRKLSTFILLCAMLASLCNETWMLWISHLSLSIYWAYSVPIIVINDDNVPHAPNSRPYDLHMAPSFWLSPRAKQCLPISRQWDSAPIHAGLRPNWGNLQVRKAKLSVPGFSSISQRNHSDSLHVPF